MMGSRRKVSLRCLGVNLRRALRVGEAENGIRVGDVQVRPMRAMPKGEFRPCRKVVGSSATPSPSASRSRGDAIGAWHTSPGAPLCPLIDPTSDAEAVHPGAAWLGPMPGSRRCQWPVSPIVSLSRELLSGTGLPIWLRLKSPTSARLRVRQTCLRNGLLLAVCQIADQHARVDILRAAESKSLISATSTMLGAIIVAAAAKTKKPETERRQTSRVLQCRPGF